jgi:hypothetical protein
MTEHHWQQGDETPDICPTCGRAWHRAATVLPTPRGPGSTPEGRRRARALYEAERARRRQEHQP